MSTITIPSIHYLAILPVLIFFGASLGLLVLSALVKEKVSIAWATSITSAAAVATLVVAYFQWRCVANGGATTTVAHAVVLDGFAVVGTVVIAASLLPRRSWATTGPCVNALPVRTFTSWLSPPVRVRC